MRLRQLEIEQLYGRFDYSIRFDNPDDIVILTAPNGYGKTAIISIIDAIFSKRFEKLSKYTFRAVSYMFDDGSVINISNAGQENFQFADEPLSIIRVETLIKEQEPEVWNFDIKDSLRHHLRPIDRYLPFIHQTSDGYYDAQFEEHLSYMEVIERYRDDLPSSFATHNGIYPAFDSLISSVSCHVIETHRLIKQDFESRKRPRPSRTIAAVEEYARELSSKIAAATQNFASAAQRLDQTFPERVLQHLPGAAPEGADIRTRLNKLEERRAELSQYGLVEKSESNLMGYEPRLNDAAVRGILSLYVNDSEKKLSTFDSLYNKIYLFASICNEHFSFKELVVNSEDGIKIIDDRGNNIPLSSLSSGEQHILVLNYDLLFRVEHGALILVDEPELSLHVAWQKRFISDLQLIQKVQPMSVVIATHSPQIINDRWDLEVPLESQQ